MIAWLMIAQYEGVPGLDEVLQGAEESVSEEQEVLEEEAAAPPEGEERVRLLGGWYRLDMFSNDALWYEGVPRYSIKEIHTLGLDVRMSPAPRVFGTVGLEFWANNPAFPETNPRPWWVTYKPLRIYVIDKETGDYLREYNGGSLGANEALGVTRHDLEQAGIYDTDTVGVFIREVDFWFRTPYFNFHIFKNIGHPAWDDLFGLYWANWEIPVYEDWGKYSAPQGVEITGKGTFSFLRAVVGQEPLVGEDPLAMLMLSKKFGYIRLSLMHREIMNSLEPDQEYLYVIPHIPYQNREGRFYLAMPVPVSKFYPVFFARTRATAFMTSLELPVNAIKLTAEIAKFRPNDKESIAFGGKLSFDVFEGLSLYGSYIYRGIYAGNRRQVKAGFSLEPFKESFPFDVLYLTGNFLWREPITGEPEFVFPPFVLDEETRAWFPIGRWLNNRECIGFNVIFRIDTTPSTWMGEWNSDDIEDSPVAFEAGYQYIHFPTYTDYQEHFDYPYRAWWQEQWFDTIRGETVYTYGKYPYDRDKVFLRVITNITPEFKIIGKFNTAIKEAWVGSMYALTPFTKNYTGSLDVRYRKWRLYTEYAYNDFGPFWGQAEWGIVYDHRYLVQISYNVIRRASITLKFHGATDYNHSLSEYADTTNPDNEYFHYGDISFKEIHLYFDVEF